MKRTYLRWVCGLLSAIILLLGVCAAVVYRVDPAMYYRLPAGWDPVFFQERYQMAGIARNSPADTVLAGTSMAANYRSSHIAEAFGGTAVRLTLPDGYFSEFDQLMDVVFRTHTPKRVIFSLDVNTIIRDESGLTGAMPEYLYNDTPLDDLQYLINKDSLYYSAYTLFANRWGEGESMEEGFTWDDEQWWNHMTALAGYDRPEVSDETLPPEAYLENVSANLDVVESWVAGHPETEFDFFFPPYSILYWDKNIRLGNLDAVLGAIELTCKRMQAHENVNLYGFLFDREIVEDLDNYCDYIHHSGAVCDQVLAAMAAGEYRLTAENVEETLADWRAHVVQYDYEKFWDNDFWQAWNREKAAGE